MILKETVALYKRSGEVHDDRVGYGGITATVGY